MIQTLKSKMTTIRADLDYQLPTNLTGEFLSAVATAVSSTPNSRTGPTATPYQLISGRKPRTKRFKSGQVGQCESRRTYSSDERVG